MIRGKKIVVGTDWVVVKPMERYAMECEYRNDPDTKYLSEERSVRVHEGHFQGKRVVKTSYENGSPPTFTEDVKEYFPVKTGDHIGYTSSGNYQRVEQGGRMIVGVLPSVPPRKRIALDDQPVISNSFDMMRFFIRYPRTSSGMQAFHEDLAEMGVSVPYMGILPNDYRYSPACVQEILRQNMLNSPEYPLQVSIANIKGMSFFTPTGNHVSMYWETLAFHSSYPPFTEETIKLWEDTDPSRRYDHYSHK